MDEKFFLFETVRLRTGKTRGFLSKKPGLTIVFKLILSAQKRWKRLRDNNRVTEAIQGGNFKKQN
jgi:hypothetical protein